MHKPLIAITMGDPAGVGPEIIVGAWSRLDRWCRALVVGHPKILRRAANLLGSSAEVVEIRSPEEAKHSPRTIACLRSGSDDVLDIEPSEIDPRAGQAAFDALLLATELAQRGQVDAITTAPLSKVALNAAGHHWPGHTELLADLCQVDQFAMMLYLAPGEPVRGPMGLGVIHVTLHVALREALDQLNEQAILIKARLADRVMRLFQDDACQTAPRIGVCALNPHSGEDGLFGHEEQTIIRPAVLRGLAEGLQLTGPLPSDTLMVRARDGQFDAVVAMVHDQGHIALKLIGMHRAVNITLGLPIVRTSVAHGTAFDLAWQGRANSNSMAEAVRIAALLASKRQNMNVTDAKEKLTS